MSTADGLVKELESTLKFLETTLSVFEPADAGFAPSPELYTVAGHVGHAADSVDWFIDGAFGDGWDMDFDALILKAKAVTSLEEATNWLRRAFANAIKVVGAASDEELFEPIPDAQIMGGAPRAALVSGIVDHTAHHRGSLAVYARLIGKVPRCRTLELVVPIINGPLAMSFPPADMPSRTFAPRPFAQAVMAVSRHQGVQSAPERRWWGGYSATHTNVPSRFSNLPRPGKGKCTA
jgi:uncharacterized damage-inducible protein DinB